LLINLAFLDSRPTGISVYAKNLCTYLGGFLGRSLDPTLLISPSALESFSDTFKSHLIPANMTPSQGTKGHLRRLIWTQQQLPHIYQQLQSSLLFSPVAEAPVFTKCRYVVTIHDTIPLRFPRISSPLTQYYRFWVPLVLNQAEHIICNSEATARDVSSFFRIPEAKITPILLGYDHLHFNCHFNYVEPSLNPQSSAVPYFLYVGRPDRYKNLPRLIKAFALLRNRGDYELWIAGSGDRRYTPILQAQVQELGISHLVKFLDYVAYDQLPNLIRGAIALVFPTLWEGFGLPVLEAMGCGTPVITSNLASLPEVTGDAGILIDPYNDQAIADAMQAVGESANLRSQLSHRGLLRAEQFRWQKTAQLTAAVLQRYSS
jgi:glycosyltransferase involved in cell wall biosynthesis